MRSDLAEQPRAARREREARMSPEARVRLALEALRRRKQVGRRPSRVLPGPEADEAP